MARMIDADRLLRELTALSHGQVWPGWTYDGIRLLIERQPTLTPPNEWVSVEERLPEDEARQFIEDVLDGIGYLYPCLLTYKSPNTERIHVVRFYYDIIQKWWRSFAKKIGASLGCRYLHRMTAARRRERKVMQTVAEHILSLSYGKDSMACFGACEQLGWPIDRVVTAEVWATDTIPADLPPMVEFKDKADRIIKERWGIEVEHFKGPITFEDGFYTRISQRAKDEYAGKIKGWPLRCGQWCNRDLKMPALRAANKNAGVYYIGIASDEPGRFHNLDDTKKSPLVEAGWTEADCRRWCEGNGLLSLIYTTETRGGCWFCHNQGVGPLRRLRKNYPEYWALMLKWDKDSPVTFHTDGHTVHDFDERFALEDAGIVSPDEPWKWNYLQEVQLKWR